MNNKQEPTKPKLRIKIKGGKKILLDSSFLSQNNKIENHYTETKTQKNDKVPHFMTPTKSSLLFTQQKNNSKNMVSPTNANSNNNNNNPTNHTLMRSVTPNPMKRINREIIDCNDKSLRKIKINTNNQRSKTPLYGTPVEGEPRRYKYSICNLQNRPELANYSMNSKDNKEKRNISKTNISSIKELQIILSLKKQIKTQNDIIFKKNEELEKVRKSSLLLVNNELKIENEMLTKEIEKMKKELDNKIQGNPSMNNSDNGNLEEMIQLKNELKQIKENVLVLSQKYKAEMTKNKNLRESIAYVDHDYKEKEEKYKKSIEEYKAENEQLKKELESKSKDNNILNDAQDTIFVLNNEKESLVTEINLLNDKIAFLEEKNQEMIQENEKSSIKISKLEDIIKMLNNELISLKQSKNETQTATKSDYEIKSSVIEMNLISQKESNKKDEIEPAFKYINYNSLKLSKGEYDEICILLSIYINQYNIILNDIINILDNPCHDYSIISSRICELFNISDILIMERFLLSNSYEGESFSFKNMKKNLTLFYNKSKENYTKPNTLLLLSNIDTNSVKKVIEICKAIDVDKTNTINITLFTQLFKQYIHYLDPTKPIDFIEVLKSIIQEQNIEKEKKSIFLINFLIFEKIFIESSHRTNESKVSIDQGVISFAPSPEVIPRNNAKRPSNFAYLGANNNDIQEENENILHQFQIITFTQLKQKINSYLNEKNISINDMFSLFSNKQFITIEEISKEIAHLGLLEEYKINKSSFDDNLFKNDQKEEIILEEFYKIFIDKKEESSEFDLNIKEEEDNLTITKKFVDNLFQEISKKFEITQKVYESESFQFIKAIFDYVLEQRKKYHEVNNISYKANKIIDAVFSQAIQKAENENGM